MRRLFSCSAFVMSVGLLVKPAWAQSAGSSRVPDQSPGQTTPTPSAPQTPGVRPGGLNLGEMVRVGGYGSIRFEANSLEAPKPAGFDFRRFVLTTDVTPHDRVQAYVEIEFERLAELEVERSVQRSTNGASFKEEIEGGNGGEISIEQMWGQFKFGNPFSVRIGQVLPPVGRFNMAHDDDRWDLPRRSLVDRGAPVLPVHAAWTELGAGIVGSVDVGQTGRLSYQAYAVNGATLDFSIEKSLESEAVEPGVLKLASEFSLSRGPVNGEGGTRAATWRLGYSPTLSSEIAVSGYHGRYTPDFMAPVSERINAVGVDGLWRRGAFAVEGEYIHSDFGDTDRVVQAFIDTVTGSSGVPPLPGAVGTETEFTIKDLTPVRQGFWIEARYRFWPAAWQNSLLGKGFENPQLTPVLRYERVTLKDAIDEVALEGFAIEQGDRQTLRQERTTVGLSYRPIPNVVFSVAVEHSRRLEGNVMVFPRGTAAKSYTSVLAGMAIGF
jgi:Phosphate-selective porin O and P